MFIVYIIHCLLLLVEKYIFLQKIPNEALWIQNRFIHQKAFLFEYTQ